MAGDNLGASFSIDITSLKAGLAEANRLIRESESEFQEAAAGMDDWSESSEGLTKRVDSLSDQVEIQRKKVNALSAAKQDIIKKMKEEGKSNEEIAKAVDGVNKQIEREGKTLDRLQSALNKSTKELNDFENGSEEAKDSVSGWSKVGSVAAKGIAAVGAAAVAAVGAFLGLAESTRETRTNMGKLETAFESAGLTAQDAADTYRDLYGVLGDEGRASESAAFLAQYADTQEELAEQSRILTGVFATYGDSIPTEGLAEGIAATISMGEVQGVLADALEWQGVSLDEFNASLAACTTEQEREALITEKLNGLYGEAADAYAENNKAVIEAQEAQADMNAALAELGAIAEPIMTTLKQLVTGVLKEITPFVAMIGEGLSGAMNGTAGAADKLAEGLSGIIDTLIEIAMNMLPVVLETIATLIPKVIITLLEQLPSLIDFIVNTALPMILTTLAEMLPQILIKIAELIPQIVNTLIGAIPVLLDAAIQFLMAIVDAIPVIISTLVAALPSIIQTVCDALINAIPLLIEAAIQMLYAIIDAIPIIIQALVAALPQIITAIINFMIESIPLLIDAAIQMLFALIDAIPIIVQELVNALPQIIEAICSALTGALPQIIEAAVQMFFGLIEAIPQIIVELVKNLPQIISAIVEGLIAGIGAIFEVGLDLVKGLWEGIKSAGKWLKDKLTEWCNGIMDTIKGWFGINSPSKLFADEIGTNLALGIGEGFGDSMSAVSRDMGRIAADSVPEVQASINGTADGLASGGKATGGGVVVYQTNNYAQAHSRYEIYKSQQATAAAVRLAVGGA